MNATFAARRFVGAIKHICKTRQMNFVLLEDFDGEMLRFSINEQPFVFTITESSVEFSGATRLDYDVSFLYHTLGGRAHPPETVDESIYSGSSLSLAIMTAVLWVVRNLILAELDSAPFECFEHET